MRAISPRAGRPPRDLPRAAGRAAPTAAIALGLDEAARAAPDGGVGQRGPRALRGPGARSVVAPARAPAAVNVSVGIS
jgi:hypothetical protein